MGLFGKRKPRGTPGSIEMMEACRDANGLIQALSDDQETAGKAMAALTRIGDPAADPLISLCKSSDVNLQQCAAIVLGRMKSAKAIPALTRLAYSPDIDVRASACLSLGLTGDERAIGPLVFRLADEVSDVQDAAAFSLSGMGDMVIPAVAASLARSDRQLRAAEDNLKCVQGLGSFDPAAIVRRNRGRGQAESLQEGIVMLINYSDSPWIMAFFEHVFSQEIPGDTDLAVVEKCGMEVYDPLVSLLGHCRERIRPKAIRSLGVLKDRRAVKLLEPLLNDDSSEVRDAAASALRNITEVLPLNVTGDGSGEKRVIVTIACEYCGVPVEHGSAYCPACGALLFDSGHLV